MEIGRKLKEGKKKEIVAGNSLVGEPHKSRDY